MTTQSLRVTHSEKDPLKVNAALNQIAEKFDLFESSAHNWTNRHTFAVPPTYDEASGVLGTGIIITLDSASHTVPAGDQFNHIAIRQATDGGNNKFTIGANAVVEGLSIFLESLSGSDATSTL